MTFNEDYTINLQLVEYQASHYTWATKQQVSSTPSTTLPNPFTIQAPASITLTDELIEYADGICFNKIKYRHWCKYRPICSILSSRS